MVDQAATLKRFSRIGVLAVALICGIALVGWTLGIPVLASIVPGWPRMALIVILCFLLCSAAVLELTRPATGGYPDLARIAAAGIVLAVGGARSLISCWRADFAAHPPGRPISLVSRWGARLPPRPLISWWPPRR